MAFEPSMGVLMRNGARFGPSLLFGMEDGYARSATVKGSSGRNITPAADKRDRGKHPSLSFQLASALIIASGFVFLRSFTPPSKGSNLST